MIDQNLVKVGAAFKGKDGSIRYVFIVHKPGSGYAVTWDSVPYTADYYSNASFENRKKRPHGYIAMREFQKWAIEQVFTVGA